MKDEEFYPLPFTPIYQYRLWGGRRLENLLTEPLPPGPIGEAWILSDRDDHASVVAGGVLKGKTLTSLLKEYPEQLMGEQAGKFGRFPLLLKFLDAKDVLSVQVHPSDDQKKYIPKGDSGKTEAWIVLETGQKARIYSGLKPGTDADALREALKVNKVDQYIHNFVPAVDDAVFIHSGTVHTLADVVVFEVQENSDTTYRLYDWDRVDTQTGKPRELQVEKAISCIDFSLINIGPVKPVELERSPVLREEIFNNEHFILWRIRTASPFPVGAYGTPRILVCAEGDGELWVDDRPYAISRGDVVLLPAVLGVINCVPKGNLNVFEIAIP